MIFCAVLRIIVSQTLKTELSVYATRLFVDRKKGVRTQIQQQSVLFPLLSTPIRRSRMAFVHGTDLQLFVVIRFEQISINAYRRSFATTFLMNISVQLNYTTYTDTHSTHRTLTIRHTKQLTQSRQRITMENGECGVHTLNDKNSPSTDTSVTHSLFQSNYTLRCCVFHLSCSCQIEKRKRIPHKRVQTLEQSAFY